MNHKEHFFVRAPLAALVLTLSLAACDRKPVEQQAQTPAPEAASGTDANAPASVALTSFSPFDAGTLPVETTNKECALDAANGQPPTGVQVLALGSSAAVGGWAGNGAGQAANGFHLVLKGAQSYSAPINIGVARPDVSAALSSPGLENSGFTLNFSLENVAKGNYAAYVADPGDAQTACDLKYSLTVQ